MFKSRDVAKRVFVAPTPKLGTLWQSDDSHRALAIWVTVSNPKP